MSRSIREGAFRTNLEHFPLDLTRRPGKQPHPGYLEGRDGPESSPDVRRDLQFPHSSESAGL
jgi:hypothetical protein